MKPQPEPSTQEVLAGLVERVTFHNAENGFCVLRAKARGHRELVTVIGHAAIISAGEWITATGDWVNDRTHGQQFKARFLRTSAPTSADGIEKYLSSGMIRGVGPAYAKKLVRAFGEKVFDVIEATPDRLREVEGIGPVRAASILAAWAEQKAVREIMVFLYSHGVGTGRRPRIWGDVGAPASPWQADATIAGPPGAVRTAADTKLQLPMGSFSGLSSPQAAFGARWRVVPTGNPAKSPVWRPLADGGTGRGLPGRRVGASPPLHAGRALAWRLFLPVRPRVRAAAVPARHVERAHAVGAHLKPDLAAAAHRPATGSWVANPVWPTAPVWRACGACNRAGSQSWLDR
jgi:hypothetical protein